MPTTDLVLVVTWEEPESGVAVHGPYADSDAAWVDWSYRLVHDYKNEGTLPPDVDARLVVLDRPVVRS